MVGSVSEGTEDTVVSIVVALPVIGTYRRWPAFDKVTATVMVSDTYLPTCLPSDGDGQASCACTISQSAVQESMAIDSLVTAISLWLTCQEEEEDDW